MPTWKNTKQREAILQVLANAQAPLSAEEVCGQVSEQYPRLALSTVYRNLERFADAGILERCLFHDGITRYNLAHGRHGHYLVCTHCNAKLRIGDCPLEKVAQKLEQDTGYEICGHDLTIYGVCPQCRKEK